MKAIFLDDKSIADANTGVMKFERNSYQEFLLDEISSGRFLSSQELDELIIATNGNITQVLREHTKKIINEQKTLQKGNQMTGLRNE